MKIKDLIQQEIDIDVCDDVTDELYIAFCGPLKLTEQGKKKFAEVMNYNWHLHDNGMETLAVIEIDDPDDKVWERRERKAIEFFHAAAGYCAWDDYEKWFEEEV